jgi:low temperature requirement protein LtrA
MGIGGFHVGHAHLVERPRLLMLVAFGESAVAIGIRAAGLPLDAGVIAAAVLGLALVACLWRAYFASDSERAEHALRTASPERQPRFAIEAFLYADIPMLLGALFIAAGSSNAIGHATEPLTTWPRAALAVRVVFSLAGRRRAQADARPGERGGTRAGPSGGAGYHPAGTELGGTAVGGAGRRVRGGVVGSEP